MPERSLISIGEASRLLGVSEAALRLWTDEGKIRAFVTPGGHRRYSRQELKRFAGLHGRVHNVKDLVAGLQEAAAHQVHTAQTGFLSNQAYSRLDAQARANFAGYGRRLFDVLVGCLNEPAKKEEWTEEARSTGRCFGIELARNGVSLTESLEAFLQHRSPFLNIVTNLMKKREALNERAVEAIPTLNSIMDEALLSLVAAYQEQKASRIDSRGSGQ